MDLPPPILGVRRPQEGHWPGRACAEVDMAFCNLRCPWCRAVDCVLPPDPRHFTPLETLFENLARLREENPDLKSVCVTGGEPTMHRGLPGLLRELRGRGFSVFLETNGTQPHVLEYILTNGIIDKILFDFKAPLEDGAYSRAVGVPAPASLFAESLGVLGRFPDRTEARTTVVPGLHTQDDLLAMAGQLKQRGFESLALHPFEPARVLDAAMSNLDPTPELTLRNMQGAVDAVFSPRP